MKEILDIIHNTIYQFFDVCGDEEEVPMSDKDKLLLEVNKAICNNLKALEQEPSRDMEEIKEIMECDADTETKCKMISNILTAKPYYFEKPEQKTGHWIEKYAEDGCGERYSYWACSKCGRSVGFNLANIEDVLSDYPYCHCGAKMVEPQESEE